MCSRFESLEPEMNNQASRVAVVNQIARQLMHSEHPSEKDIKAQQDKLNTRQVSTFILRIQNLKGRLLTVFSKSPNRRSAIYLFYHIHMNSRKLNVIKYTSSVYFSAIPCALKRDMVTKQGYRNLEKSDNKL